MNDQEREVIADIFRRLEQVAEQPRDPEAERFIADRLRLQPYAPYAMAQTIFVQEQALSNLQTEVESLRAQVEEMRRQPQPQPQGGILSSLFGGGPRADAYQPAERPAARQGSPWGAPNVGQRRQPFEEGNQPGNAASPWGGAMGQQQRGGGFLQGALSTAAGVAGGMMLANALTSAFKGDPAVEGTKAGLTDTTSTEGGTENASITDQLYDNPPEQPTDDFADFGGDEGDWT